MKTIGVSFITLCGLTFVEQACGQDERRTLRNDPTYSTQNYKHPNKAATARKWEAGSGVVVEAPKSGSAILANYKRQVPNQAPTGGIRIEHTPSTNLADRNYKIQRPMTTSTGSVSAGVAGNRKKRGNSGTLTGN